MCMLKHLHIYPASSIPSYSWLDYQGLRWVTVWSSLILSLRYLWPKACLQLHPIPIHWIRCSCSEIFVVTFWALPSWLLKLITTKVTFKRLFHTYISFQQSLNSLIHSPCPDLPSLREQSKNLNLLTSEFCYTLYIQKVLPSTFLVLQLVTNGGLVPVPGRTNQ